jgi:hypothetical protein
MITKMPPSARQIACLEKWKGTAPSAAPGMTAAAPHGTEDMDLANVTQRTRNRVQVRYAYQLQ